MSRRPRASGIEAACPAKFSSQTAPAWRKIAASGWFGAAELLSGNRGLSPATPTYVRSCSATGRSVRVRSDPVLARAGRPARRRSLPPRLWRPTVHGWLGCPEMRHRIVDPLQCGSGHSGPVGVTAHEADCGAEDGALGGHPQEVVVERGAELTVAEPGGGEGEEANRRR